MTGFDAYWMDRDHRRTLPLSASFRPVAPNASLRIHIIFFWFGLPKQLGRKLALDGLIPKPKSDFHGLKEDGADTGLHRLVTTTLNRSFNLHLCHQGPHFSSSLATNLLNQTAVSL